VPAEQVDAGGPFGAVAPQPVGVADDDAPLQSGGVGSGDGGHQRVV